MDNHCTHLRQMIARHRDTLTTDDQRQTFLAIEHVLVRTYIPAVKVISNPFDVDGDGDGDGQHANKRKRAN
jgi:hypothetical protein